MKRINVADKLLRKKALRQEIRKKTLKVLIFNQEVSMVHLGLSRMKIREYQLMGVITGLKKYS